MHTWRLPAVLCAAMLSGGCLQSNTLIMIKGDGSGTIEQNIQITTTALAQLRQLAALSSKSQPLDPFSDEQMRALAGTMGPGVTFVSSTPISTASGEGRDVIYAFSDVNQLRIREQPPAVSGSDAGGAAGNDASRSYAHFALTREPNGDAMVRIAMPPPAIFGSALTGPGTEQNPMSPERLAMRRRMFGGMRIAIAVEPVGHIVSTTSPFVDGNRVTLLDLDFDQMLQDDTAFTRLQNLRGNGEQMKATLKDIPGLKVCLDKEITIEFRPGQAF